MRPTSQLEEARERLAESIEKMQEWDTKSQALPDTADEKEIIFVRDAFQGVSNLSRRRALVSWLQATGRTADIVTFVRRRDVQEGQRCTGS